jgi:hypothetical protein
MENSESHIREPLNLYSIFGYLLPGFFLTTLMVIDYDVSAILRLHDSLGTVKLENIKSLDLKANYVLQLFSTDDLQDYKFIPFILFLLFCYLIGHVVSAFSSFFIERLLVKWTMGFPSFILLNKNDKVKFPLLFGNYRRPLKTEMIKNIGSEVEKVFGFKVNESDYYWLLYSYIITIRPYLAPRVHHFVNLYGFSRNVCATFLIYFLLRISFLNWFANSPMDWAVWAVLSVFLVSALLMFYNYLKLFKRQAIDIYYLFLAVRHDKEKYST